MTTHKLTTTDDAGRRSSFAVRPDTPLGRLITVARADTRRAETPAAALEALAAVHQLEMFLEISTDDLALAARRDGATWDQIGSALGLTRQRAHQRWGNISTFAGWDDQVDQADDDDADRPERLTAARARLVYYRERSAAEPNDLRVHAALRGAALQITRLELELAQIGQLDTDSTP